jgi:hypothetical protein
MKVILPQQSTESLIEVINANLLELEQKVNTLVGAQGDSIMLGDLDMQGHRVKNVRTDGTRDAITQADLEKINDELNDTAFTWALILGNK